MPQTVGGNLLSSPETLLQRFLDGQRGALARLLTYVENDNPIAEEVLQSIYQRTGNARIIGVTGPPGAGKSTLTNALIQEIRKREKSVGVIAIDPSSALSGGSTLGDRIRMLDNYADDGVFIRSMATRGHVGGLSLAAGRATQVLDAFGFDVIILETVGIGQDEISVTGVADTTILVQIPGAGDSVQTIKAGILEITDIIAVNKSDQPGALELVRDLRAMLRFRDHPRWLPPVVETVATSGDGIEDLVTQIQRHAEFLLESGESVRRAERRAREEIRALVVRDLSATVDETLASAGGAEILEDVVARRMTPAQAVQQLNRNAYCTAG